jgi:hypothetical protein
MNSAVSLPVCSELELAQAATFILTVQQAQGGLVSEPIAILQFRYGLSKLHACALASQLEELGFWALFTNANGMQQALTLRR